jgi:hypothetical protein
MRRHRSRLKVCGLIILGVGLVTAAVSLATAGPTMFSAVRSATTSPSRVTPFDTVISLRHGKYSVYELTGHRTGGAGLSFTENGPVTLAPDDVQVTGPDGAAVPVTAPGVVTETLTRGGDIYTAAARIDVPAAGHYRVQVTGIPGATLIITPSLGAALAATRVGLIAGGLSVVALIVGLALFLAGVARSRKPGPLAVIMPVAGWYADPYSPGRLRYFDGRQWTPYQR